MGWFTSLGLPGSDPLNNIFFSGKQQRSFYIYGNDPNTVEDSILGSRLSTDQLTLAQFLSFSSANPNMSAFISPKTNASIGLLGTIPTRYWLNYSLSGGFSINGFQPIPLFTRISQTADSLDDEVSSSITRALQEIAQVDKSILLNNNANRTAVAAFFLSLEKYLAKLPYGGVYFSKVSNSDKKYEWILNIGIDKRLISSTSFPPPGIRQLYLQTALDNAVLRNSNVSALGDATISQGYRAMPQLQSTKIEFPFDGLIGGILYPLGISFLLPIFVTTLVKEKEERIAVMMKLNGLKTWVYYFSHYGSQIDFRLIFSYILDLIYYFQCYFHHCRCSLTAYIIHSNGDISIDCNSLSLGKLTNIVGIFLFVNIQPFQISKYIRHTFCPMFCHYWSWNR